MGTWFLTLLDLFRSFVLLQTTWLTGSITDGITYSQDIIMTCFPRQILCFKLMRYIDQAKLWKTTGVYWWNSAASVYRPGENQRAIFNGQKRIHSIKFQSGGLPNWLVGHLYGSVEGNVMTVVCWPRLGFYRTCKDFLIHQLLVYPCVCRVTQHTLLEHTYRDLTREKCWHYINKNSTNLWAVPVFQLNGFLMM